MLSPDVTPDVSIFTKILFAANLPRVLTCSNGIRFAVGELEPGRRTRRFDP
jgi:hypothetical protein